MKLTSTTTATSNITTSRTTTRSRLAMVVLVNFIVDVLYAMVDPRLKASDA